MPDDSPNFLIQPLPSPAFVTLTLPGSKSEANRLLVAAALSGQAVTVTGASPSDDVRYLVAGLASLGFAATWLNDGEEVDEGEESDERQGTVRVGPRSADAPDHGRLFCGNAGTALRFLVSVAAITPGEWLITGDAHMQKRPIQPLIDAWRQLGVQIAATAGRPPVHVLGGSSKGGSLTIDPTLSSQFVSSLLLVGAQLPDGLEIRFAGQLASRSYAQLTCSLLARVGVSASLSEHAAHVASAHTPAPTQVAVGGDWSGMGVWTCLNHLTGSNVTASNLTADSGQADEQLGKALQALTGDGERTVNVEPIPDQFLNLAVTAAFRRGTTHLTGAANVRVKECDRVAVMARELRKLGADLDEHADGLSIRGGQPLCSATIDPEDDHRVAMAFALLGLLSPGIAIANAACVEKSYPTFWNDLEQVLKHHQPVALIGMRASGKTTLGKAMAEQSGSVFVDTDACFVAQHGPIAAFVAKHGWPAFRQAEARIVARVLLPGHIIATGGGAIESEATRTVLAERCQVIWLRAEAALLRTRLANDQHRPSLTGAPVTDEIDHVLALRNPWYQAIANRIVAAYDPLAKQLAVAMRAPK